MPLSSLWWNQVPAWCVTCLAAAGGRAGDSPRPWDPSVSPALDPSVSRPWVRVASPGQGWGHRDILSEAVLPTWELGTVQQGTRVSRVLAAKPLTLAFWLPSVHWGQTLGGDGMMPASSAALGQGASLPVALLAFPTPASPCPSPCGATRAWVGFV